MIQQPRLQLLRRILLTAAFGVAAALPAAASAADGVPARVRVVKASRGTPAHFDPRLEDVRKQVSALAWQRWELVSDQRPTLALGQSTFVALPDGSHAALSVAEVRGDIVTIEVAMAQKNTQTRVTIEKGQRIVHQVAKEKGGVALFIVVTPWP